uniref:Uncharacterized protein n=1 Tax=Lactuca sativa TaxID=4236 RepID=A0A9R1VLZ3_LACSA|nr:hypothetical protein LSAT_V11C500239010 [Lactuca sativa]
MILSTLTFPLVDTSSSLLLTHPKSGVLVTNQTVAGWGRSRMDASMVVPLLSPVLLPMAQSIRPILSQIASTPTIYFGAEMTLKNLENLNPRIMKQIIPLIEQLPPLYMELANGRDNFSPQPEETQRLVSIINYVNVNVNPFVEKYAISSVLDMSIRSLPGDHGLPLQKALPDVPPGMVDVVNRGGELFANLTAGTLE